MPPATSQPYTRWWWFSAAIREDVIRSQLDWARANGFGGVEIAWLYPLDGPPGPRFLSPEWAQPVIAARRYAAEIGLGCDFTVGSAWPFGGPDVPPEDASLTCLGLSPQRLEKSWDVSLGVDGGYILNHLDRAAVARYLQRFGGFLAQSPPPTPPSPTALFCDSWEVLPEDLWARDFGPVFQARFGYDIRPYMPDLDAHPAERYDYRKLINEYALDEFYAPYAEACHRLGAEARVQCHGAPADIVAAYALADVPETEALLFDCDFAAFAASGAALAGRPVVSSETFTCLYGWVACPGPGPHQGEERLEDLKLIADALFANGVNHIVWHGMPYNPPGGGNRFYATTHVGPDSAFAGRIAPFNAYLARLCSVLRAGQPYTDLAVYLPLEDTWMQGELPPALQKPSSRYVYELQEMKLPPALAGYRPMWVSSRFLRDAQVDASRLRCGPASFSALYIDAEWLDADALADVLRLARRGLPICLKRAPRQPGRGQSADYPRRVAELSGLPNVSPDIARTAGRPPLVAGDDLPDFWCRVDGAKHTFFFAHPAARGLRYPLDYSRRRGCETETRRVTLNVAGRAYPLELVFQPHQSILLHVDDGGAAFEDIRFDPA